MRAASLRVGEDVDVDVLVGRAVHAVPRLAQADGEAARARARGRRSSSSSASSTVTITSMIPFAREARDGGRAEVLDPARGRAEGLRCSAAWTCSKRAVQAGS